MTNPDTLLAAILADPANDDLRMVFADLLDDRGESDYANFIRVQVELANLDPYHRSCTGDKCPGCSTLRQREFELWGYLPRRDGILSVMKAELPEWAIMLPCDDGSGLTHHYPWAWVRRGFVAEVRLSCQDWFAHGPALVRRHPIERCVLTGCTPLHHTGSLRRVYAWAGGENGPTTPYHIPGELLSWINWGDSFLSDYVNGYFGYPTESAALDALEKAALLYARQTEPATARA